MLSMIEKKRLTHYLLVCTLLAFSYVALARLAWILAIPPGNVTAFWPASGMALFFLLRFGIKHWPGIFVGNFLGNVPAFIDGSNFSGVLKATATGVGIAIGDSLQTVFAVLLIAKFLSSDFTDFDEPSDVVRFLLIVALTHLLSPLFGVSSLYLGGYLEQDVFLYTFITWFTGDAIGCIFTSLFLLNVFTMNKSFRLAPLFMMLPICLLGYFLTNLGNKPFYLVFTMPLFVWYAQSYMSKYVYTIINVFIFAAIVSFVRSASEGTIDNNKLIGFESYMVVLFLIVAIVRAFVNKQMSLQANLEKEQLKSIHNAKLASLGEMAAGMAHEINNPLAIIQGYLRVLPKVIHDRDLSISNINKMKKATDRIAKVVHSLRKFSRSDRKSEYKLSALNQVIDEAVSLTEPNAKRHFVSVELKKSSNCMVLCDEIEIEQVLINLINNAIDAVKDLPEKWVKIDLAECPNKVSLRVSNSGDPMEAEVAKKIFDPFYTTKPVGEGTGLGLSITKGILDQHNATIEILPDERNTCFEICFEKSNAVTELTDFPTDEHVYFI